MNQEQLRKKKADKTFSSVPEIFLYRIGETPDDIAFDFPDANENWQTMDWKTAGTRVKAIAGGLRSLGIGLEDRCAILSLTRIEWLLADIGILCAGGATTTIYPSNTPAECEYIIADSATRLVFCEDASQVAKLQEIRESIPEVFKVVVIDGKGSDDGWVMTLADLEKLGDEADEKDGDGWYDRIAEIKREHLATLIYTSGTTGTPKGVELLHDCWVYTAEALDEVDIFEPDDKQFLWLPMSHSFGKVLEGIAIAGNVRTAIDGRIPKIVDNLSIVRPTWMAAAPRIFEKVYNKIVAGVEAGSPVKKKIFYWALGVGKQVSKIRQDFKEPTGFLAFKWMIAQKLVFNKVKERFGGRVRFFISGSAPLSLDMAEFFHAAGILILEGYGLTESSAASFVNLPNSFGFGTVGPPLPGTELKIVDGTGEILIKSRGIMRGYHNLPEVSAETLKDGWLYTGDKGENDSKGRLKITGRIKELIKTSGGKYVAPAALESRVKALCPYISQVVVHGDTRNFCSALVTMDPEGLPGWASENGLGGKSYAELSKEPAVIKLVQDAIDKLNSELPSYSTIKKFALLEEDFAVETGELTASLKVKRRVVEEKYMSVLDGFYKGAIKSI